MSSKEINHLKELLASKGRHGQYQKLPPTLPDEVFASFPERWDTRLDEERYNWIISSLNCNNKTILEIGANIGYFASRFASEGNNVVYAYEPDDILFEALESIIRMGQLGKKVIPCHTPVDITTINSLPNVDIILNLNVIQHAGFDFEKGNISSIDDWREYAVDFLSQLRSKSEYMVFQMGYQLWGHDKPICKEKDIIQYTISLLRDSGWLPQHCGIVTQMPLINEITQYHSIDSYNNEIKLITRNKLPMRYLFEVFLSKITQKPYILYSFTQRPIFICKCKY